MSGNTLFIDANNLISGAKIRFPFIPPEFSSIKIAVSPKSLSPEIAVSPELFYFPCNDNAYFIQKIQGDCYQQQRHITTCTEHLFSFSQRAGDTKRNSSTTRGLCWRGSTSELPWRDKDKNFNKRTAIKRY